MISGWILENGDHLKKVVVSRGMNELGGGVDLIHEGTQEGVSIDASELDDLIALLTKVRDEVRSAK